MTHADRVKKSTQRSVTVSLSEFCAEALARGGGKDSEHVPARLVRAVRLYLGDRDSGRPGWPYPASLRDRAPGEVELELVVDEDVWARLEEEAKRQEVSVSQLAGHAALYYAAELDAGRITQRILDSVEGDDSDAGGG